MKNVKKILITGKDSYIGESLERWLKQRDDKYIIDTIDMKDPSWETKDFSKYDSVFHVAGIAHIKETKDNKDLYYKVNRDLAYKTAKKAKEDGVKQFIFLSSMSVYGMETGVITRETKLNPKSAYGKSKYEAELLIKELENNNFKTAILRPPMVYGPNSKGNYQLLSKFAKSSPIFPKYQNKRSMIYIDNLNEFVKVLVDNDYSGIFFPQNKEYVSTSDMVKEIAKANDKDIKLIKTFNPFIRLFGNINVIKKVFGNLYYDESTITFEDIQFTNYEDTIKLTEDTDVS